RIHPLNRSKVEDDLAGSEVLDYLLQGGGDLTFLQFQQHRDAPTLFSHSRRPTSRRGVLRMLSRATPPIRSSAAYADWNARTDRQKRSSQAQAVPFRTVPSKRLIPRSSVEPASDQAIVRSL